MQRRTLRFGEESERERERERRRNRTSNAREERRQGEEKAKEEGARETKREKEGCALTVGIHERSPPGGLACERTLCSSLSTPCLPPSFSFSPLTYRLIFFTGPEVGRPRIFGCWLPTFSSDPPTKRSAQRERGKSVIWETTKNSRLWLTGYTSQVLLIGHRNSSRYGV